MPQTFLEKTALIGWLLAGLSSGVLAGVYGPLWAAACLVGFCWIYINFFILVHLMRAAVAPKGAMDKRVAVLTILKFPVIYLAGFFVLQSRFFPMGGILAGLSALLTAVVLARLWDAWASLAGARAAKVLPAAFLMTLFSRAVWAASAAHGSVDGGHGEHAAHAHPEVLTWVGLAARLAGDSPLSGWLLKSEKIIFAAIVIGLITWCVTRIASKRTEGVPGRAQAFMELVVSGLDEFVQSVMGARGRRYTPFVGSLFIYILISNLFGLIPLQNSIMAYLTTVVPLAICVFFYVQWIGITQNGLLGYLHHLAGSPRDIFGWMLAPLMFPLHVMGEFIKPLSLSFRLYGNIMAGHVLLAVFMGLGIELLRPLHVPAGIPLHFPFLFLEILVGLIQAFVFTLLSTIYISMMLPHEHEHEQAGHAEAHGEHKAH